MRNRESNKIRRFLDGWNDYNLLVKSENGKPNLKAGFSSVVRHLANKPVEKYVLVDLDTTEIDGFVDDIRERVRQRHQGTGLRIGDAEQVCRCREMVAKEVALENDRGSDPEPDSRFSPSATIWKWPRVSTRTRTTPKTRRRNWRRYSTAGRSTDCSNEPSSDRPTELPNSFRRRHALS
ncbi:hypothetical protein [Halorussus caseinilyticus]